MQSFHLEKLKYNSGKTKSADMLYTFEILKKDFTNLKIFECKDIEVKLDQGINHQGKQLWLIF